MMVYSLIEAFIVSDSLTHMTNRTNKDGLNIPIEGSYVIFSNGCSHELQREKERKKEKYTCNQLYTNEASALANNTQRLGRESIACHYLEMTEVEARSLLPFELNALILMEERFS